MNLSELKPAKGSIKKGRRVARGQASGSGGTAGRGHKGAKSRSGYKSKRGFEGGQMPLQRRVPKRGFKSLNGITYRVINLSKLQELVDKKNITEFNLDTFKKLGFISRGDVLKVLGNGKLTAAIQVEANAVSQKAKEVIEAQGGKVSVI